MFFREVEAPGTVSAFFDESGQERRYRPDSKTRRKDPFYIQQHDALARGGDFPNATSLALKFKTTSQRYYLITIQPHHRKTIEKAVGDMLSTAWGNHFCLL